MLPSGASGGDDAEAATVDVTATTGNEEEGVATDARIRALSETLRGFERPRSAVAEGSRLHFRALLAVLLPKLPLRDDSPLQMPLLVEELLLLKLLWRMYRLVHSGSSVSTIAAFSEMILLMCCSRICGLVTCGLVVADDSPGPRTSTLSRGGASLRPASVSSSLRPGLEP